MTRKYKVRSIDTHDFDSDPDVCGVITDIGSINVEGKERPYMVVDNGQSLCQIFQSTALDDAFKLGEIGDSIHIQYRGKVKLQGGKTFKRFNVQVWTEEIGEDESQEETKAEDDS